MRLFLFAVTFLSLFHANAAGGLGDLESCRRQCSSACKSLAAQAIEIARDIQDDCGSPGGDPDVVDACNSTFYSTQDKLECSRGARSGEAVRACSSTFYSTSDKLSCASKASDGEAVRACGSAFYSISDKLDCSEYARSRAHVERCSSSFYSMEDKLKCIGKP